MELKDTAPSVLERVRLLKAADVAHITGLSRSFVYSAMDRGLLAYVRIGRTRRVRPEDVDAMIERCRVAA